MDQKNFKKCHSRNLEQTDLILDFLSTLDKTKGGYSWRQELSEINKDWTRRMDNDELDGGYKNQNNRSQSDFSTMKTTSVTLSPSKKVTWSSKLTNVKTISPKQPPPPSLESRLNSFSSLEDDEESTEDTKTENGTQQLFSHPKSDHCTSDQNSQDLVRLKSLHKQHFHHGRAAQKMQLISIVPNNL